MAGRGRSARVGDIRRETFVIVCGDSDLRVRISSNWSEGGGSNLLRLAIYQMVECHGRSQGTTGRRNGSCYDAAIVTVTWENIDCLLMTPADCTFNLVINKGALDCVM